MVKFDFDFYQINTIVIGSGAAGLNAAIHFVEEGGDPNQITIVSEKIGGGTSFNAGSDKQTYYKLSIGGDAHDSIREMAESYRKGGSMHGDIALVEAANSIREFMHLVSLGVPFPTNKYGEYIGYKTDNDPKQRATSVGPLTSKIMGEKLLKRVKELNIPIHDNVYIFKIFEFGPKKAVMGLYKSDLAIKLDSTSEFEKSCVIFLVDNIIAATGGSSAIYHHSVYPLSQWGSLGLLIEYGCEAQNLTESQFGLASTDFRWNVSGTYQQVIPTYLSYSVEDGIDSAEEFLIPKFPTQASLLNATFLKGYQWPFNVERIQNNGSSQIDLSVFEENSVQNRIVVLDYRRNPFHLSVSEILDNLDEEFAGYLQRSGIDKKSECETPVNRLRKMNPKAYELYLSHNIDLEKSPLKISVCAQHCNGGISGDIWWESTKPGVFVIGEANGSHGVHRPGGSALNSGQVGGLRASLKIIRKYYDSQLRNQSIINKKLITSTISEYVSDIFKLTEVSKSKQDPSHILNKIRNRMAKYGTIIRTSDGLSNEISDASNEIINYFNIVSIQSPTISNFLQALKIRDALITHLAYLHSIQFYLHNKGGTRGSYLVKKGDEILNRNSELDKFIITSHWKSSSFSTQFEEVREVPQDENWFETVWKSYENGKWIS